MKVITLCGSFKYQKEMMIVAEKLALRDNCVLTPVYPAIEDLEITEENKVMFRKSHYKRIEMSDAIVVINVDNYIGRATVEEIEYAKSLGKEVLYYTDLDL